MDGRTPCTVVKAGLKIARKASKPGKEKPEKKAA
jgi:hypothetical protein